MWHYLAIVWHADMVCRAFELAHPLLFTALLSLSTGFVCSVLMLLTNGNGYAGIVLITTIAVLLWQIAGKGNWFLYHLHFPHTSVTFMGLLFGFLCAFVLDFGNSGKAPIPTKPDGE